MQKDWQINWRNERDGTLKTLDQRDGDDDLRGENFSQLQFPLMPNTNANNW